MPGDKGFRGRDGQRGLDGTAGLKGMFLLCQVSLLIIFNIFLK